MDDALTITEAVDKLGTVFLGVALIYALYKQHIVFGWYVKECQKERDYYRAKAERREPSTPPVTMGGDS